MRMGSRAHESGLTLIEVMIAISIMSIALFGLLAAMFSSSRLIEANKEEMLATNAARQIMARLKDEPFDQVFASMGGADAQGIVQSEFDEYTEQTGETTDTYDQSQLSNTFYVDGMNTSDGDPVGTIYFPTGQTVSGEYGLLEYLPYGEIGMPRDLNGDGTIDQADHSDDYMILPVMVEVRWEGVLGERSIQLFTILGKTGNK